MKSRINWARASTLGMLGAAVVVSFLSIGVPRAQAELAGDPSVSATATADTTTVYVPFTSVVFYSEGADDVRIQVYDCETCGGQAGQDGGEAVACSDTTFAAAPIELESGQQIGLTHEPDTDRTTPGQERGRGYCGYSIICDTGNSATVRVVYK